MNKIEEQIVEWTSETRHLCDCDSLSSHHLGDCDSLSSHHLGDCPSRPWLAILDELKYTLEALRLMQERAEKTEAALTKAMRVVEATRAWDSDLRGPIPMEDAACDDPTCIVCAVRVALADFYGDE